MDPSEHTQKKTKKQKRKQTDKTNIEMMDQVQIFSYNGIKLLGH